MAEYEAVERVLRLFEEFGSDDYIGEEISQTEHAIQAHDLALRLFPETATAATRQEFATAALLHDVGHLLGAQSAAKHLDGHGAIQEQADGPFVVERMGDCGISGHERLGAQYLRQLGFRSVVCELVEGHVIAKRYLARDPEFLTTLSPASTVTLEYQGGPLSDEAAAEFAAHPFFDLLLILRRCDDLAKVPHLPLPSFSSFERQLVGCLHLP